MIWKGAELYNVHAMIPSESGFLLSRVPDHIRLQLNENAQQTALNGCGTEIRFNLHGETARIRLRRPTTHPSLVYGIAELYYGPFLASWEENPRIIGPETTEWIIKKPTEQSDLIKIAQTTNSSYDPHLIRMILPYDSQIELISIEGEISPPRMAQVPSRRYLAYGSSITHGGASVSPSETYAMQVARALHADLINLGFAGSAQMDVAMAEYISSRMDWDFATLELGINVINDWTAEQFEDKVYSFVTQIAKAHPTKHIFCIDLFRCGMDIIPNQKIEAFRNIVCKAIQSVKQSHLHYLSGLELLPSFLGLGADVVHPTPRGMSIIADHLALRIHEIMTAKHQKG